MNQKPDMESSSMKKSSCNSEDLNKEIYSLKISLSEDDADFPERETESGNLERPVSPVFSVLSMESDVFSNDVTDKDILDSSTQQERPTSPDRLSLKSDCSMFRPENFTGLLPHDSSGNLERPVSPVFSVLSMESDVFSNDVTDKDILDSSTQQERPTSPDRLSLKSDCSMFRPENFTGLLPHDSSLQQSEDNSFEKTHKIPIQALKSPLEKLTEDEWEQFMTHLNKKYPSIFTGHLHNQSALEVVKNILVSLKEGAFRATVNILKNMDQNELADSLQRDEGVCQFCEKLQHQLKQQTYFLPTITQGEKVQLQNMYIDTLMELLSDKNERLGYLEGVDQLLSQKGVFNDKAQVTFITGDAGTGKSILLQQSQSLWSKGELDTGARFLFAFSCRQFSAFQESDKISLWDLIFKHNYTCPDGDMRNNVVEYILKNPEMAIFTFDGYDEINSNFDQGTDYEISSPEETAHPLVLLKSLLSGKLLNGSQKVVTARTGTEFLSMLVRKRVILKGFSIDQLQKYTDKYSQGNEDQKLVSVQINSNHLLQSLCLIPLFCWIVFESCSQSVEILKTLDHGVTLTSIFMDLVRAFFSRSNLNIYTEAGSWKLRAFAKLAHLGMEKEKFVLNYDHLSSCGIGENDLKVGILIPASYYDNGKTATFQFMHLTLQSFLTALHLVLEEQMSTRGILQFFPQLQSQHFLHLPWRGGSKSQTKSSSQTNEHHHYTNLFLCGLLSKQNNDLQEPLMSLPLLRKKQELLFSFLSDNVKLNFRNLPLDKIDDGIAVRLTHDMLRMLRLGNNRITGEGGRYLANAIQRSKAIYYVGMWGNKIGDEGAKHFAEAIRNHPNLSAVSLAANGITFSGGRSLAAALKENTVLKSLWLHDNELTDDNAADFAEVIRSSTTIHQLWFINNKMTVNGVRLLASSLQYNPSITMLCMKDNLLSAEEVKEFENETRMVF
ncbi:nucleotide-binding oligomerization domain-containing protein 1 isoform X5 [Salmo trutta]|uniref:nucleotide-binding oligomerization domain-containing protein 1 isoform X5 n=1 Tax=Salmo trutta TaxID=8032 RepID=UPI001130C2E7|nr:nucleotide-binding oligomerization domain-containing protein 1-like isoform X5 [Salmo trutta]